MTAFDYFVLLVIGISVAIGSMRGAIKEIINLVGWLVAFWSGNFFGGKIANYLTFVPGENLKIIVGFIICFFMTLIIMGLLSSFLSEFTKAIGLEWLDKMLGIVFGLARAGVIIVATVTLIGLTSYPKTENWQKGTFTMPFEALTLSVLPLMPEFIAKRVKFE